MPRLRSASALWLTGIVSAALVLVVASVILNIVTDDRSNDLLSADSPEGTVQRYLIAVNDHDVDQLLGYIDEDLKTRCEIEESWRHRRFILEQDRNFSAKLSRTSEFDGSTLVTVEITESDFNPPFAPNQYSFRETFTLTNTDGTWRISEPPWPMGWCPLDIELPVTPATASPPAEQSSSHRNPYPLILEMGS